MRAGGFSLLGYERLEELKSLERLASWRGRRERDGRLVLVKSADAGLARSFQLQQLGPRLQQLESELEWGLSGDQAWVARPWHYGRPAVFPLGLQEALEWALSLLEQLRVGHNLGLVHGGVHPENVLVEPFALLDWHWNRGGPLLYRAPECLGLLERAVPGPGADLYGVGMLLYCALGGRPFEAVETHELLRQIVEVTPPPLRSFEPELPRALDQICQRLLHKEPGRRYQHAEAVLHDLRQLRNALRGQANPALLLEGGGEPQEAGFVVRLAELGRLQSLRQGVQVVRGAAGSGKSSLLRERAVTWTGPVFQASARLPRQPLQVLDELNARVREFARDHPEWQGCARTESASERPLSENEARAALISWLNRLPPCLLLLDDMHWADQLTWQVLLGCSPQALVLLACRPEGVQHSLSEAEVLELGPLSEGESEHLLRAVLGSRATPDLLNRLLPACGGDPFLAVELALGSGEEVRERTALALRQRLQLLPPVTLEALGQAAVLGRSFSRERLAELVPQAAAKLGPALSNRVIYASGASYVFAHDRLREECLERVDPALRRQLHGRLADLLERQAKVNCHDLSFHLAQSEQPERSYPYALRAGREARQRFAFDLAEEHYRRIEHWSEHRPEVLEGLAETLLLRGRYCESAGYFEALLQEEGLGSQQRTRVMARLAYVELNGARLQAALGWLERALTASGVSIPQSNWRVGAAIAWELARLGSGMAGRRDLFQAELLVQYSFLQFFAARPAWLLWAHLRAFNLCGEGEPHPGRVRVFSNHSIILVTLGRFAGSEKYGSRALQMAEQLRSDFLQGMARTHRALGRLYSGRLEEARQDYDLGLKQVGAAREPWMLDTVAQNLIHLDYLQGRFAQAARRAAEMEKRASDRLTRVAALRYWARCSREPDQFAAALPEPDGHPLVTLIVLEVQAMRCYLRGEYSAGSRFLEEAVKTTMPAMEVGATWAWLATLYRLAGEVAGHSRAVARALKIARKIPIFQAHAQREAAWREARLGRAGAARELLQQSLEAARRIGLPYEEALTLKARHQIGQIFAWSGLEQDLRRARQLFFEVGAWWEVPAEAVASPALSDRYQQLLRCGAEIVVAYRSEDLRERILEAAGSLLRSERIEWQGRDSCLPLVRRAFQQGEAVVWTQDDRHEHEVLAGVRSGLACVVGPELCLYATHSGISDFYGRPEVELIGFLARLSEGALQNARLWSELESSEAHFRTLFYGSGLAMALVDGEGRVVEHNGVLESLRAGDPFEGVLHADDVALFREHLRGRMPISWEVRYGSSWGQLTLNPLPRPHSLLALSDVSFRKLKQIAEFSENERRLLASEIHDELTQPLAGLTLLLQSLETHPELRQQCEQTSRELLEQLTRFMRDLRSPTNLREGLEALFPPGGLTIAGELSELPKLTAIFLYRIVQECCRNARRHGGDCRVWAQLTVDEAGVRGWVEDDGPGTSPDVVLSSSRSGVRGMRERAEMLGGELRVCRSAGLRIEFELPRRAAL